MTSPDGRTIELGAPRQRPFGPRLLFVQTPHSHSEPQSPRSVHAASDELKWLTKYGQSEAVTSHSHNSCSLLEGWKCFTAAFRPAAAVRYKAPGHELTGLAVGVVRWRRRHEGMHEGREEN